jgi:hypothetical protein
MEGPIFSALIDIAALTGKAAASVPVIPPLKAGPLLDDVCAELSQQMENGSREMTAELARTAAQLEAMIFEGKIGFADEMGES